MSITLLLFSLILFQQSICTPPNGCSYISSSGETKTTDENFLTQNDADENENIHKCFALASTEDNTNDCCYYKDTGNKQYCTTDTTLSPVICARTFKSKIANNCGMALFYQPQAPAICTEISLVDGFCCYVDTTNHGKACVRQEKIDEDNKSKITDEIKNEVKRLLIDKDDTSAIEVKSVQCEGTFMTYYGLSLLLLSIIL